MTRFTLSLLAVLAVATPALAQVTALPGGESGRIDDPAEESQLRTVARGVLFVPRTVIGVVFAPIELGMWALDRYQLADRAKRLFFNDAGTIGLFPTARLESGFGLNVGARFVHRDLFGASERLSVDGGTGGRFRQLGTLALRSGDRFGKHLSLELEGTYERRPKDVFYGIGNGDGDEARFRQRVARVTTVADVRVIDELHLRAAGALADFEYGQSDVGTPIMEVFQHERIVGFDGSRRIYGELELRWDTRRRASIWDPAAIPAAGTLAAVFAGHSSALDGRPSFWRYGADFQHFLRVAEGPRVFAVRAHLEAVTGKLEQVPFGELPRLGGKSQLRGYPADRFRDRIATVGSFEYRWDLMRNLSASAFVDAGRVHRSLSDLSVDELRVGYGIGIEAVTEESFLARVSLASSIDGGVFVDFSLDPVFELDRRVQRQ